MHGCDRGRDISGEGPMASSPTHAVGHGATMVLLATARARSMRAREQIAPRLSHHFYLWLLI